MDTLEFAKDIVIRAGSLLLTAQEVGFQVSMKGENPKDVVTTADKKVNEFLISKIREQFPDHDIYSEEGGNAQASEYQWVIDPVDGTANFSRGIPHFAVCVGLLHAGVPVVGVVYNPVTEELFSFKKGEGAYFNGSLIRVSQTQDLKKSFVLFAAGRKSDLLDWSGDSYTKILHTAHKTKNFGSSSLDTCYVACGRVEAAVYGTLTTLDIASALGILEEAGGVYCNEKGELPAFSKEPQRIYIANSQVVAGELRTLLET